MNKSEEQVAGQWERMLPSSVQGRGEWLPCATWDSYHHNYQKTTDGIACADVGSHKHRRVIYIRREISVWFCGSTYESYLKTIPRLPEIQGI